MIPAQLSTQIEEICQEPWVQGASSVRIGNAIRFFGYTNFRIKTDLVSKLESPIDFVVIIITIWDRTGVESSIVFHAAIDDISNIASSEQKLRVSQGASDGNVRPPLLAEFIIELFSDRSSREHVMGDCLEQFETNLHRRGRRYARYMYNCEAIKIAANWLVRKLASFGLLAAVVAFVQRHIS